MNTPALILAVGNEWWAAPTLLAAGFVHPALLTGLALPAVPILIHLLSRRYYRRVTWGATRFLLEAERENRRRVRFEQWLLLALRCLAMALLALLVARPFAQPGLVATLLGGRGQVQRIIVLDDSASLSYREAGGVEFERLRSAATRLLSWLQQEAAGDPVSFYLTSRPEEALVENLRLDAGTAADLRGRVEKLAPVSLRARPARVVARIAERLTALGESAVADLYVLSDFQRSDWFEASDGSGTALELLRASRVGTAHQRATIRVVLVASGVTQRANVAIEDVRCERPQTVAGLPALVRVDVVNHSARPREGLIVQMEVDGAPLPAVPLGNLDAQGRGAVPVEVTFLTEGYREITAQLSTPDSFPPDDTRRIAVHVKEALAVLLVNGAPDSDPRRDEVYLARHALSPPGPFGSGVSATVSEVDDLAGTSLDAYDCVVVCNVAPPGVAAVEALEAYVRRGGGLAIFLGDRVGDVAEYNRVFHAEGTGLLPLALQGEVRTPGDSPGVGLVRTAEHPVTAMFPAGAASLSEQVHFFRYYRCVEPDEATQRRSDEATQARRHAGTQGRAGVPPAEPGTQPATRGGPVVLARYADAEQTPALVERSVGAGRVILFTSSADLDWNDWARAMDGSYVVTLLELVQYIARRDSHPHAFVTGERLAVAVAPEQYEPRAMFRSPNFPAEPACEASRVATGDQTLAVGEPAVLQGPLAATLGTYRVELLARTGPVESRPLCVNLAAAESDLAVATTVELDAALLGVPHQIIAAATDFVRGEEQARRELWPALLVGLAVALMAEQTLAWWFGRPRSGRA